ncbi:hypothetical protein [Achromobacter sp. 2789STDY5608621]|uniref:hypothetical protein n=1 Tax=Achromobacter sp. 2789STDY5608621 TaxID=1806496 RepID=UPI0012E1F4C1|nr:hypothetical protein [Achromobacter sp. 2789STDY5608621]
MDKSLKVGNLSLAIWEAMFRPGMAEFAASTYNFSREAPEQVRIAFGNQGPIVDTDGNRMPVFTHAVTLPPAIAVDLARQILEHYAKPADDSKLPIAPI